MCPDITCHERYDRFMPNTQNMSENDAQLSVGISDTPEASMWMQLPKVSRDATKKMREAIRCFRANTSRSCNSNSVNTERARSMRWRPVTSRTRFWSSDSSRPYPQWLQTHGYNWRGRSPRSVGSNTGSTLR